MSTKQAQRIYEFGPYRVDGTKRLLLREGQTVPLTPKSFEILLMLVERSGEVISKETLINRVWPDSFVEEGNLTYNISILRKALGERAGEHQYIATVPGRGYQFVEVVEELTNEGVGTVATHGTPTTHIVQAKANGGHQEAVVVPEAARAQSFNESSLSWVAQHKRAALIACSLLVIAGGVISLGIYKLIGVSESRTELVEPFHKMKITRLTTAGQARAAAISPDGKYVAHAMGGPSQQSLWLRHVATGSDTEIVPNAPVNYTALTFSPDGNFIYFLRVESVEGWNPLYRVPVLGGSIQKLGSDIDAGVTFSPDGQKIAYIRGYPERGEALLLTASSDGSDEQTFLSRRSMPDVFPPFRAPTKFGPAWSPDGQMIAFGLRKDGPDGKYWNLMVARVKDQVEQQITFQKWSVLGEMAWLSDGSGLVVEAAADGSLPGNQIWHVAYPGGEVRRITNDTNGYIGVRLTADSNSLVTVRTEQSSNIWIAPDGDYSRARQITNSNLDGVYGVFCTTDGRVLYTTSSEGSSNISIANMDGTSRQQLTFNTADNFSPEASPDGRYIVFSSTRTGNRCIWRTDIDGSNPKQLTYDIDSRVPAISPDGKWVVYWDVGSGTKSLWKVSIEGGDAVQLTDYYSTNPAISPDGKQIVVVFLDDRVSPKRLRIAVIPSEGGPPAKVFDFPRPPGQRVGWSPDGRALTYLDTSNGVYNIWAQPLDGGPPRQLTNFTTDQILAYAWSRDGKLLACARGNRISDVVLITDLR